MGYPLTALVDWMTPERLTRDQVPQWESASDCGERWFRKLPQALVGTKTVSSIEKASRPGTRLSRLRSGLGCLCAMDQAGDNRPRSTIVAVLFLFTGPAPQFDHALHPPVVRCSAGLL
jgi:hypothetical protein